ncbi:MAG: restriction endonuclease subunit S [Candidatus Acididesulfobacter guangdongensis]|uniref:Restriction endonuclease subunit S n=1 Tax=Acididesulfobacter guangdongensis TaxID=2597225 RepID=A0A519BIP5_ACIG2|nr:MAG: restriction endonuclease subunit S [Candidatus Acididesulfobacter guangdongensis]
MKWKPYPKYKDSGVEWIGEVPEHWDVKIVKYTTYLKGRVGWKGLTSEEYQEDGYAYLVTGTDFLSKYIDWNKCHYVEQARYNDDPFIQLRNGDLLITKDGTIGKLALVEDLDEPACLNSGIFLVRPKNSYITEYFYWVLGSDVFAVFCDLSSLGSTIQHLYQNVFENFVFPVPSIPEQKSIAAFLDRETAKIDTLITKQERLIELLLERRKALISHAVTKGLDPNAKMKDSGVEWIGEIPKKWKLDKIKHNVLIMGKSGLPASEGKEEGLYPFFTSSREQNKFIDFAIFEDECLIMGNGGSASIHYINGKFSASNDCLVLKRQKNIIIKFLYYLIFSNIKTIDDLGFSGIGLRHLQKDFFYNMSIYLPATSEQLGIVSYIDRETTKIDTLIEKSHRSIKLLRERRKALISAAVTGKIDVREAGA